MASAFILIPIRKIVLCMLIARLRRAINIHE
jgi:hypothetical protein